VFASTDVQDDPLALSRLAEYFVEMGQLEFALRVAGTLVQKYPEDLNALIARAQVAAATSDSKEFSEALASLLPMIERGEDDGLPWDRRVGLAVVLAQARRQELARKQLERSVDEADETLLRSLSNGALYRFLVFMQRSNLHLPDAELRDLAPQLLPAEMRDTLE
jgi:predicted negative regulator of RcsB-dependent stress response